MGTQLSEAGVTGVLILAKDADGKVDARAAKLPGASVDAQELEQRTVAALESMAGVQGHPDAPAAELGHALRPDKESNWLPCPAEGTWFIILRMYQPHDEVVQATWRCPAVRNVG